MKKKRVKAAKITAPRKQQADQREDRISVLKYLGITREHLSDSLIYCNVITILGLMVVSAVGLVLGFKQVSIDPLWVALYIFISVPLQELVFRGAIQTYLYRFGEHQAIAATAVLYALLHVNNMLLVFLTFFAGIAWGYAFSKRRNIVGPIVSHTILGVYLFVFVI